METRDRIKLTKSIIKEGIAYPGAHPEALGSMQTPCNETSQAMGTIMVFG